MDMIKKIYTILVLIKNLILRKKHYKLHFIAENDPPIKRWYYDFKYWGFDKANLEMVAGADSLCELYAKGNNEVTVDVIASRTPLEKYKNIAYDEFIAENIIIDGQTHQGSFIKSQLDKYLYGRDYTNIKYGFDKNINRDKTIITRMWICPVTLFVLGRYPNFIYIKNK
jgi:hypothetical protein